MILFTQLFELSTGGQHCSVAHELGAGLNELRLNCILKCLQNNYASGDEYQVQDWELCGILETTMDRNQLIKQTP